MNKEKSILQMARGGFMERVDYEMPKIIDNILDANTKATAKRKLTITMEFIPDDERTGIVASFSTKLALAPTTPLRTTLYVSGEDSTGEVQVVEMAPQIPGQVDMNGEIQEPPATLKLVNIG